LLSEANDFSMKSTAPAFHRPHRQRDMAVASNDDPWKMTRAIDGMLLKLQPLHLQHANASHSEP
jgi:hypothetical protein